MRHADPSSPDLKPGSPGLRAARRFLAAGPEKHGRSETRVPQIACGTPNLGRRTAKPQPIWSPGRPDRVRHADSLAPDRKSTADLKPGSPGLRAARRFYHGAQGRGAPAPRRRRDGDDFHFENQAQVSISEVLLPGSCSRGFPAPPPRRLRTAIVPGFYAPGRQNRRCLLYTSPSPRDKRQSRMPSSA